MHSSDTICINGIISSKCRQKYIIWGQQNNLITYPHITSVVIKFNCLWLIDVIVMSCVCIVVILLVNYLNDNLRHVRLFSCARSQIINIIPC